MTQVFRMQQPSPNRAHTHTHAHMIFALCACACVCVRVCVRARARRACVAVSDLEFAASHVRAHTGMGRLVGELVHSMGGLAEYSDPGIYALVGAAGIAF